jgi:hypothetical protein
MGKSRMMGAGFAGSLTHNINVNGSTGGGSKKQGLVATTGFGNRNIRHVRTKCIGSTADRFKICFVNQLGGVGRGRSAFNVPGMYTNVHGAFGPRKYPDRVCYYNDPYDNLN